MIASMIGAVAFASAPLAFATGLTGFDFGSPADVATGVQDYGISPASTTVSNNALWIGLIIGVAILLFLGFLLLRRTLSLGRKH